MEYFEQIKEEFREICKKNITLPPQTFTNANLGIYSDDNMDAKCFSLCLAKLAGIVKKNGDSDLNQIMKISRKVDLTEKQLNGFLAGIDACKTVCELIFITCF